MNIIVNANNKLRKVYGNILKTDLPIVNNINYDNHNAIILKNSMINDKILYGIFVHNTNRGRAQGGLRIKQYPSFDDMISDGLRLSKGMTYKNSLANLWWGGGKAIINYPDYDTYLSNKKEILHEFAELLNELDGYYITATDMGATTKDMDIIYEKSRFVTTISKEKGGSDNPSESTARGIYEGLKSLAKYLNKDLTDLKISIQGFGSVGYNLYKLLKLSNVNGINIYDICENNIEKINSKDFFYTETIDSDSFVMDNVDILCPCATGNIFTTKNIDKIKARYIIGGANNQLENDELAYGLHLRNILWIPDYLINRMGIVNCANEFFGSITESEKYTHFDRTYEYSIPSLMKYILEESEKKNIPPLILTNQIAEKNLNKINPILGNSSNKLDVIYNREFNRNTNICDLTGISLHK